MKQYEVLFEKALNLNGVYGVGDLALFDQVFETINKYYDISRELVREIISETKMAAIHIGKYDGKETEIVAGCPVSDNPHVEDAQLIFKSHTGILKHVLERG